MTNTTDIINRLSSMIKEYLSCGLFPDDHTISFIKSTYGLSEPDEIFSFIEGGDDDGAVIDMISYPSDSFRESIEEFIPPNGFSDIEIKSIEDTFSISPSYKIFIRYNGEKIFLSSDDSLFCSRRILQRLNLNISMDYISLPDIPTENFKLSAIRALLRKKKFISGDEISLFINDLICNYSAANHRTINVDRSAITDETPLPVDHNEKSDKSSLTEFLSLIDNAADFLNNSDRKPFDILSEKKYYYENAIMEAEEFSQLLKTYSMEFIMLKRIQPPLISVDEARLMISIIDELTSIVYRMIIPSVRNVVIDGL